MLVCIYEDRIGQLPGVKLLVASLQRHAPNLKVRLRFPGIPVEARRWLEQYPAVTLLETPLEGQGSYNVKPNVLLDGLSTGASTCLWLDTDVLINGPLIFLERVPHDTLIATDDPWSSISGSTIRCSAFGLAPGRTLRGPLNSALVRVGQSHRRLIEEWACLLKGAAYLGEQAKPVKERNALMLGDQDALSAVAASATYGDLSVKVLRHPQDILQHHGPGAFGLKQRMSIWRTGMPPLLHAMGGVKPWNMTVAPRVRGGFKDYYERLYLESSPYLHAARTYSELFGQDAHWLKVRIPIARVSMHFTKRHPALAGAGQAIVHNIRRYLSKS